MSSSINETLNKMQINIIVVKMMMGKMFYKLGVSQICATWNYKKFNFNPYNLWDKRKLKIEVRHEKYKFLFANIFIANWVGLMSAVISFNHLLRNKKRKKELQKLLKWIDGKQKMKSLENTSFKTS